MLDDLVAHAADGKLLQGVEAAAANDEQVRLAALCIAYEFVCRATMQERDLGFDA